MESTPACSHCKADNRTRVVAWSALAISLALVLCSLQIALPTKNDVRVVADTGNARVEVGHSPTRPQDVGLYLYDTRGALVGELSVSDGGTPTLMFRDKDGHVRLWALVSPYAERGAELSLYETVDGSISRPVVGMGIERDKETGAVKGRLWSEPAQPSKPAPR
jgi:hypothetical protein